MRGILIAAVALLLPSCTNVDAIRTSWHGRGVDDLIASWGPPSARYAQEGGGQYLVYRAKRPEITYQGGDTSSGLLVFRCVASFKTDGRGVIVSSDQEGSIGGCARLLKDKPSAPLS